MPDKSQRPDGVSEETGFTRDEWRGSLSIDLSATFLTTPGNSRVTFGMNAPVTKVTLVLSPEKCVALPTT